MPVVLGANSISVGGKVVETSKYSGSFLLASENPTITYTYSQKLVQIAEQKTGVNGWIHVKHLPTPSNTWYRGNDNLQGNFEYNQTTKLENQEWAIKWDDTQMNQILFTKGSDISQWLHLNASDLDTVSDQILTRTAINNSHDVNKKYIYYRNESSWTTSPYLFDRECSYLNINSANFMIYQEQGEVGYSGGVGRSWPNNNSDFNPMNFIYDVFVRSSAITKSYIPIPISLNFDYNYILFEHNEYDPATQTSYTVNFPASKICDILVVGGGGGGGRRAGGGGGAGALLYHKNQTLNGTYNIKVGKGGRGCFFSEIQATSNGRVAGNTSGYPGEDSQFIKSDNTKEYLAKGGAGGHGGFESANNVGGSAGGRGYGKQGGENRTSLLTSLNKFNNSIVNIINNSTYDNTNLILPEGCYGNLSGDQTADYRGGGGGGAGGVGMNHGPETSADDGYGGDGLIVDITGTNIIYAGGGNGSDFLGSISPVFNPAKPTIESRGGGGYGSDTGIAQNGLNGSGGGGGGQGNDEQSAGNGGSGIVIIRYLKTYISYDAQWTYNALNANVYHLGNVGIGITNPTFALHVFGNTQSTTYSASSKTFKIEHPLKINKWLYHGCVEGPRFDNIYRGKKLLTGGKAEVDIDTDCNTTGGMTPGTFDVLNTNTQLFLRNNQTYDRVKGKINGSTISIECENATDDIEVDWMVVGERHDEHVINTPLTDSDGNLICEHDIL